MSDARGRVLREAIDLLDEDVCRLQRRRSPDPALIARLGLAADHLRAALLTLVPFEVPANTRWGLVQSWLIWPVLTVAGLLTVPNPAEPLMLAGMIAAGAVVSTILVFGVRELMNRRTARRMGRLTAENASVLITIGKVRERLHAVEGLVTEQDREMAEHLESARVWLDSLERHRATSY